MRLGFQQNDLDSSAGPNLSGSLRKAALDLLHNGLSPGQSYDGSFRKSKSAFHQDDLDAYPLQNMGGSSRKSKHGVCKGAPRTQPSNKSAPISRRLYSTLKYCSKNLVDLELFTQSLEDWILENSLGDSMNGENSTFNSPFQIDELRQLDFALEGVLLQQLFRMPCSFQSSEELKEEEYYALEDFLYTMADGLWRTFWHRSSVPMPMYVSCARHPRSKFYSLEKSISRGKLGELSGAALISCTENDQHVRWDQVALFALFKPDIMLGNKLGLSSTALCEALFYGIHILLSRKLSKCCPTSSDSVYILVLDSKFGGVVKLGGDLQQLEVNSDDPYGAVVEWIKVSSEISVSPVDRIWNKLGNVNWGDMGTLQLLLATFYSTFQFYGPPRRSILSLAADHSLRLQKRRIECHFDENKNGLIISSSQQDHYHAMNHHQGEIVEVENGNDVVDHFALQNQACSRLNLQEGELILVDDNHHGQFSFQIQYPLMEGTPIICYSAVSLEKPDRLLTLYVGAHPSRLEPSWEDMSLWYQVQRQTKVLNAFKQARISTKYLPQIVSSGKILHPGSCTKMGPGERCDHPWCGTPVLVTFPVGDPLSCVVSQKGFFSSEEAIKCCRDCLSALRSARQANVQHGDICPENILRVNIDLEEESCSGFSYIPVSWGRAVLEERDSPAINLLFSSSYSLQHGKLCPSSDVESLVYVLYFLSGGVMQQQDSIESALQWRQKSWAKRVVQRHLGEVSALLKAFADYVDSLCGTPYPVDFDGWLKRLDSAIAELAERGKMIEQGAMSMRIEDVVGSSSADL